MSHTVLKGGRRRASRWIGGALALAVVVSAGMAPVPPAAAVTPVATVRIPRDLYRAGWGDFVAAIGDKVLAWSPADNGSLRLSTGTDSWQELDSEKANQITNGGQEGFGGYYIGGHHFVVTSDRWVNRVDFSTGSVESFATPDGHYTVAANGTLRVYGSYSAAEPGYWAQPLAGGDPVPLTPLPKLVDPPQMEGVDAGGAWATDLTMTVSQETWWNDDHYNSNVYTYSLDGSGGFSFATAGRVIAVMGNLGSANTLRYITNNRRVLQDCSRTGSAKPVCKTIPKKPTASDEVTAIPFGNVLALSLGSTSYIWEKGKLKRVKRPAGGYSAFEGPGAGTRPVYSVSRSTATGDVTTFYTVKADGSLSRMAGTLPSVTPVATEMVDLGTRYLVGLDDADGTPDGTAHRAWVRDVDAGSVHAERVVSQRADSILTSGSRYVVDGADGLDFYDGDTKVADTPEVYSLYGVSGPYALVRATAKSRTSELRTAGGTVARNLSNVVGNFGSLVATLDPNTWRVTVTDYDPATPVSGRKAWSAPIPDDDGDLSIADFWGDWVGFSFSSGDATEMNDLEWRTYFVNYRTGETSSPYPGYLNVLGDGVAMMYSTASRDNLAYSLASTSDESLGEAPEVWPPTMDDKVGAAYVTGTDLVVRSLGFGGRSAPRVLGWTAGTELNTLPVGTTWTLAADATKALGSATVEIVDAGGVVRRTLDAPDRDDGAIRVSWDGNLDDGVTPLEPGEYTWRLTGTAIDASGALVGVDGDPADTSAAKPAATGTLRIVHEWLGTIVGHTPTVSDTTPAFGQTLTAIEGGWTPSGVTFSYQWERGGSPIDGATQKSYVVAAEDIGASLSVVVSATADGWHPLDAGLTSAGTAAVVRGALTSVTAPTVSDLTPVVDQATPLVASATGWGPAPVSISYRWYRVSSSGKATEVATGAEYTPTASDAGSRLKVVATGSRDNYADASATSRLTGKVAKAAFQTVAAPTIDVDGVARVGKKLCATPGESVPSATTSLFQWYRVKGKTRTAIHGAGSPDYTPAAADVGYTIVVRVIASRLGYEPGPARYSTPSAKIQAGLSAVTPKLDDTTPVVGQALSITAASDGSHWGPVGVSVSYQWYVGSQKVDGATGASYVVAPGDLGQAITLVATGTLDDYAAVTRSVTTAKVTG